MWLCKSHMPLCSGAYDVPLRWVTSTQLNSTQSVSISSNQSRTADAQLCRGVGLIWFFRQVCLSSTYPSRNSNSKPDWLGLPWRCGSHSSPDTKTLRSMSAAIGRRQEKLKTQISTAAANRVERSLKTETKEAGCELSNLHKSICETEIENCSTKLELISREMAPRANGFEECSPLVAIDVQPILFRPRWSWVISFHSTLSGSLIEMEN